jgi:hypothetical protein
MSEKNTRAANTVKNKNTAPNVSALILTAKNQSPQTQKRFITRPVMKRIILSVN